ncbi:MAG: DUF5060 domain-containing protein [Verrucomicrobiota bacterium]
MRIRGHNGSTSPDLALQPGEDPEEVGTSGGTYRKAYTLNWSRRQARNPRQMFTNIWHWEGKRETDRTFDFVLEAAEYELNVAPRALGLGLDRMVLFRLAGDNDGENDPSYTFLNNSGFVPNKARHHQLDELGYSRVEATVTGELKRWHKTTLDLVGPFASENETPNPFMDFRMSVTFHHSDSNTTITTPGYFAADGNAANTGASSGDIWRAHFSPPEIGEWTYEIGFRIGDNVAIGPSDGGSISNQYHGETGTFTITESDKSGDDFRSPEKGKLLYTGKHYPEWAGGAGPFIKAEANVPEVFLAYGEFDSSGGFASRNYASHINDWNEGDPTWLGDDGPRGKGIIGAINYLSSLGVNCHYFLTMNVEGDGGQTHPWPHNWKDLNSGESGANPLTFPDDLKIYDASKLAQWQIVFDHMMSKGLKTHFVLTEQENQSFFEHYANIGVSDEAAKTTFANSRKLYYRELAARFGYLNAITWNIGEENGWDDETVYGEANDDQDRLDFATYLDELLPYPDQIVVHNPIADPGDAMFTGQLGLAPYSGVSLQGNFDQTLWGHDKVLYWRSNSVSASRPWIISYDEPYTQDVYPDIDTWRKDSVWAAFTAGAAGVGFYNDEDTKFRGEDGYERFIDYYDTMVRATDFLSSHLADITLMNPDDDLVSSGYCLANPGNEYLIYLPNGGNTTLDLSAESGDFQVLWFDPRNGGNLALGSITNVSAGGIFSLGSAPNNTTDDWVILVTPNTPPTFLESLIVKPDATGGLPYNDSIFGTASDIDLADTTITYSKVSGPVWLSVANDGTLSGTPSSKDVGENLFTVAATDTSGLSATTSLMIQVLPGVSTPLQPVVHYDASDDSSITKTGNDVSTWANIGTGGFGEDITVSSMTQSNETALDSGTPGIGWPNLERATVLTGTDSDALFDFQNGSATGGFTIMAAMELVTVERFSSILSMFDGGQTPNVRAFVHGSQVIGVRLNDTTEENFVLLDQIQQASQSIVFAISYDAATGQVYYWDSQGSEGYETFTANADFSNGNVLYLGGNDGESLSIDANFGEFRIYDDTLSASEFSTATDEMVEKWVSASSSTGPVSLVVHYDASNVSSVTKIGDNVSNWANIGSGEFGEDITVSGMKQNGSTILDSGVEGIGWANLERAPVLSGGDSDALFDFQNESATGGFTIMAAMEFATVENFSSILSMMDGGQTPNIRAFVHSSDVIGIRLNDTTTKNSVLLDRVQQAGVSIVFGITYDAATGQAYYWDSQGSEGYETFTANADFSDGNILYLGGNDGESLSIDANFGEFRIYDNALSSSEFRTATSEMVQKWISPSATIEMFRELYGLSPDGSDDFEDFSKNSVSNIYYFLYGLGDPFSRDIPTTISGENARAGIPKISVQADGSIIYSYTNNYLQRTFSNAIRVSDDMKAWYAIDQPSAPIKPFFTTIDFIDGQYEVRSYHFEEPPSNIFFRVDPEAGE